MAKPKPTIKRKLPAPNLIIPRTEAESEIFDRIASGKKLLRLSINNENELEAAKAQRKKWNDYNEALLKRLFDSEAVFEDYDKSLLNGTLAMKASWRQRISSFYEGISSKITALELIIERLEFIPEKVIISETQERSGTEKSDTVSEVRSHDDKSDESKSERFGAAPEKVIVSQTQERSGPEKSDTVSEVRSHDDKSDESKNKRRESAMEKVIVSETQEKHAPEISDTVFVVHGQDDKARVSVAKFLEKLGLKAVVFREQANAAQTIVEKLVLNAAISGYAVVILTPDDIGASKENPDDTKFRAKQNVILELGYFCGALGRKRVSVLVKDGVEIPNDNFGVTYTLMDSGGTWQLSLARDMKSAGLSFDANKIF